LPTREHISNSFLLIRTWDVERMLSLCADKGTISFVLPGADYTFIFCFDESGTFSDINVSWDHDNFLRHLTK
jgi:hypothetical protein